MGFPTRRDVFLVDGSSPTRERVSARLYRDLPVGALEEVESRWAGAREQAASAGAARGLAALEHSDWDWRNKADSVEAGNHLVVAIECDGETQGLMAVSQMPFPSRIAGGQVVYVDYVESAPWNLRATTVQPRFLGVGTVLIAEAVRLSLETGLGGAVGLHSLPQAETFYTRCGMTKWGIDPNYFDLPYYEFTHANAANWLAKIGESR